MCITILANLDALSIVIAIGSLVQFLLMTDRCEDFIVTCHHCACDGVLIFELIRAHHSDSLPHLTHVEELGEAVLMLEALVQDVE